MLRGNEDIWGKERVAKKRVVCIFDLIIYNISLFKVYTRLSEAKEN